MEWAREMATRLERGVNGEKDRIIAEYQEMTGRSPATLYRLAAKHGYNSGRRPRRDKGKLASGLTDEQIRFVSTLIQTSSRQVKGHIMPVGDALEIATDNGIIQPGQISVQRMAAILREREMNGAALDAPTPSIRMRSLHPNHVHVFDASVCIQYYLKNGKGMQIIDERDYHEKKPANCAKIKNRLIRMILADHFSHQLFLKYYEAPGENQRITFDFLCTAWSGDQHEKIPMRGVPLMLLMDAGSANIARGILALLERLEIVIPKNMPHNPRRQGSAECAQNIVESHFESRLRFDPASTIEQINAWALDWVAHWNASRIHGRHGMTRTACWLKHIRQEHIRELPGDDMLRDLYAEPEVERTVRQDNTIDFRANSYPLRHVEGIRPGRKVKVVLRPYHWPQVVVMYNDAEYLVSPLSKVAGGFAEDAAVIGQEYKAQPDSPAQKVRKENDLLAYGEDPKKGAVPFGGTLQVFGHQADKIRAVPMPRRGVPMEVGRTDMPKEISIMEFFKRLREAGVVITTDLNRRLRQELGSSVDIERADEIMTDLMNDEFRQEQAEAMRVVG